LKWFQIESFLIFVIDSCRGWALLLSEKPDQQALILLAEDRNSQ
jgi:hypothetical protein